VHFIGKKAGYFSGKVERIFRKKARRKKGNSAWMANTYSKDVVMVGEVCLKKKESFKLQEILVKCLVANGPSVSYIIKKGGREDERLLSVERFMAARNYSRFTSLPVQCASGNGL
jgi:predicted acetyltransferase